MRNLDLSALPSRYRAIAKRYVAIEQALDNLPEPCPDLTGMAPHERDLIETYLYCLGILHHEQLALKNTKGFISIEKLSIDCTRLNEVLNDNMSQVDQNRAVGMLNNAHWRITHDPIALIRREKRPNLMKYFEEQKIQSNWLPQGSFNEDNLTWVAWNELLKLVEQYGYNPHSDDPSELSPISEWDMKAKDDIFHLMLEMIDPEKIEYIWTEKMGRDLKDLVGLRHRRRAF